MSNVATINKPSALQATEADVLSVMESSIYPGAKRESILMALSYCRAQGLDPLQKPVHIVPMSVKQGNEYVWRDVIMPGIGLYRVQAARTGEYAGNDEGVFGPDVSEKLANVEIVYPEWCAMTVYRFVAGHRVAFSSGRVYWKETYSTQKRDTVAPNAMWTKRPRGQLEKCAEAMALRRAFPELGAVATAEEMEGKVIDVTEDVPRTATMPQAKAGTVIDSTATTESPVASPGQVKMIRGKLAADGCPVDEAQVCQVFQLAQLGDATVAIGNAILGWLAAGDFAAKPTVVGNHTPEPEAA